MATCYGSSVRTAKISVHGGTLKVAILSAHDVRLRHRYLLGGQHLRRVAVVISNNRDAGVLRLQRWRTCPLAQRLHNAST